MIVEQSDTGCNHLQRSSHHVINICSSMTEILWPKTLDPFEAIHIMYHEYDQELTLSANLSYSMFFTRDGTVMVIDVWLYQIIDHFLSRESCIASQNSSRSTLTTFQAWPSLSNFVIILVMSFNSFFGFLDTLMHENICTELKFTPPSSLNELLINCTF